MFSNHEYTQFDSESGFTLIELLVVVAIIGVLSSVVLASLSGARDGAKDSAIKQAMRQMQTQAELYKAANGHYYGNNESGRTDDDPGSCSSFSTTLFSNPKMTNLIKSVINNMPDMVEDTNSRIYCGVGGAGADSWAFAVPLHEPDEGDGWCVDSSGAARFVSYGFSSNDKNDRGMGYIGGQSTEASCQEYTGS